MEKEEKNKIYEEIRKEKIGKTKKLLLKKFGNFPIFFMTLLSCLILTISTVIYLNITVDFTDKIFEKFGFVEPIYTIYIVMMGIGIFSIYFFIFMFSLMIYSKKLELSLNEKK